MGLLDNIVNALAGGLGMKTRSRKFDSKLNYNFAPSLTPGAIILQWPVKANFVAGGIQGGTDSVFTHVIGYAGRQGGELVRRTHPELMTRKLNPIPATVLDDEFVEATTPVCRIGSLSEYLRDDIQMIAFCLPDLTELELSKILGYAYGKVGTPYDMREFFSDAFPLFGISHCPQEHVCSSLWSTSYAWGGRMIVKPGVNVLSAPPKEINGCLYPQTQIPIVTWNWNPFHLQEES